MVGLKRFSNVKADQVETKENLNNAIEYVISLPNDIEIVCHDAQIISTNKVLLSTFSPYLRLLFSESPTACLLHLQDFSSSSVQEKI